MSFVIWFTGLSGSGKSTLAEALTKELQGRGENVFVVDGDEVRALRKEKFGFSREDIRENNRLVTEYAREKSEEYDFVLVSVIAPYEEDRKRARQILGEKYVEVFVDCPLGTCEARDVKGLYQKARSGEITNFIGVADTHPYEKPISPEITIRTDSLSAGEGVKMITRFLFSSDFEIKDDGV